MPKKPLNESESNAEPSKSTIRVVEPKEIHQEQLPKTVEIRLTKIIPPKPVTRRERTRDPFGWVVVVLIAVFIGAFISWLGGPWGLLAIGIMILVGRIIQDKLKGGREYEVEEDRPKQRIPLRHIEEPVETTTVTREPNEPTPEMLDPLEPTLPTPEELQRKGWDPIGWIKKKVKGG